ncbi:hypothetical protein EO38_23400, partial [Salmonella enterica subsp. enterica serovar Heidelberg]|nr:hypothetical protein [Salmonella enterica subsp. enterica serovar Heidelberg]
MRRVTAIVNLDWIGEYGFRLGQMSMVMLHPAHYCSHCRSVELMLLSFYMATTVVSPESDYRCHGRPVERVNLLTHRVTTVVSPESDYRCHGRPVERVNLLTHRVT